MYLQTLRLLLFLAIVPSLFCGCRGLQSELQKSKILAAGPTATVLGTELRLESSLKRTFHSDGRKFDLKGQAAVIAEIGSLPKEVEAYHMALKPSWKGWPGYYVLNFTERNGIWSHVRSGHNNRHLTFRGTSKRETNRILIEFTWPNLGGLMSEKPEHFATFDVSLSLLDAKKNRYILTNTNVPTD